MVEEIDAKVAVARLSGGTPLDAEQKALLLRAVVAAVQHARRRNRAARPSPSPEWPPRKRDSTSHE
ncbi:MAG: hypothetical protein ABGY42_05905, partial [bacterium]